MNHNNYLIIGGSTKCGTTSVFSYFEFHPEICPCIMKESRYFWTNDYPLESTASRRAGIMTFDELFTGCRESSVRLEATPDYLYSSASAKKIRETLPHCKMVFILRDPIDRLVSWYKFAVLNGLIAKSVTISEYVKMQIGESGASIPQHMRSLEQGKYTAYLNSYIERFGKENILITFYEDLAGDPFSFCAGICSFAGIDTDYFTAYPFRIYNQSVAKKSVGAHKLFRRFKRTVRPATRLLHDSLRKRLKLAGYKIEQVYTSANKSGSEAPVKMDDDLLQMLIQYYTTDVEKLQQITGKKTAWSNFINS